MTHWWIFLTLLDTKQPRIVFDPYMIPTCIGTKFASRTRLAFPGISQSSLVTVGALWARVLIGSFCSRQAVISCWTFYWFDHAT